MAVPLTMLTLQIPRALEGEVYSAQMQAGGGTPPYSWSVVGGFGSLPTGMSLSAAGLLSAALGAIPATAVGTWNFRLRVQDGVPDTVFRDVSIDVLPSGYDSVPNWLIDPILRSLADRVSPSPVTREKVERHFFRDLIGVLGDIYAHHDEDIYCLDWRTPGNNVDLRTVLEAIYIAAYGAVRTINTIPPDALSDFTIRAGTGITITPIPNGVELAASATGGIGEVLAEGDVSPWMTLSMPSADYPDTIEAWIRDDRYLEWHRAADLSSRLVKHLNDAFSYNKYVAMALGDDGAGNPVVHTVRYDGGGMMTLERYDGRTLASLETLTIPILPPAPPPMAPPAPMVSEPLLMVDPITGMLFMTYVFQAVGAPMLNNLAWFVCPAMNYAAFTLATVDFTTINPDSGGRIILDIDANEASADDMNCKRLYGTFDVNSLPQRFHIVMKANVNPPGAFVPILVEIQNGAAVGWMPPFNIQYLNVPPVGQIDSLDVLFDPRHNYIWWLVATNRWAAVGGNLDLYTTIPSPIPIAPGAWPAAGPLGPPLTLGSSPNDGMEIVQAMMGMDSRMFGVDGMIVPWLLNVWRQAGPAPNLRTAQIKGAQVTNLFGPPALTTNFFDEPMGRVTDYAEARFGRWFPYAGGGPDDGSYVYLLNPEPSKDQVYLERYLWDWSGLVGKKTILNFPHPMGVDGRNSVVRTAHVNGYPNMCEPRGFASLGWDWKVPFFSADSLINPDCFNIYYDETALQAIFENNTPFTWHVKMKALVNEETIPPPNLLISCYQFARAMKNYYDATAPLPHWYPSPSAIAGVQVNWSEVQLAAANVGGFQFSTYYSVPPGGYDLYGGSIAAGRFFSDEAATLATDYTFVFRYNTYPASIVAAEAAIRAALNAFLLATPPLPHGTGINPNFYTLAEVDALLGTTFATTYVGPPYDYYRYFLFTNVDGLSYEDGYFSQNYVDTGVAYGPHPASGTSIPVSENFTVTAPGVPGVPDYFDLSTSVSAARVYVNGVMYLEGIDWEFDTMNRIKYLNRAGGYVLSIGPPPDVVTVEKWNL